jgi:hypothetical protein
MAGEEGNRHEFWYEKKGKHRNKVQNTKSKLKGGK